MAQEPNWDSIALTYLYTQVHQLKAKDLRLDLEFEYSPVSLLKELTGAGYEQALNSALRQIRAWEAETGSIVVTPYDAEYPQQLLNVWDYPLLLFLKGRTNYLPPHDNGVDIGVSLVGSRQASTYARAFTEKTVHYLADEQVTIVSGLAEGIDQVAHKTSLARDNRTVGVIGTGLGRYYPTSSRPLQQAMEQGQHKSMVLTQFLPLAPPAKHTFPMRNGVMSAYGCASIIVEASENSGTRHQASQAIKHGRALILTDQVATTTSWGKHYASAGRYPVQVVATPEQAAEAAFSVIERSYAPAAQPPLVESLF